VLVFTDSAQGEGRVGTVKPTAGRKNGSKGKVEAIAGNLKGSVMEVLSLLWEKLRLKARPPRAEKNARLRRSV